MGVSKAKGEGWEGGCLGDGYRGSRRSKMRQGRGEGTGKRWEGWGRDGRDGEEMGGMGKRWEGWGRDGRDGEKKGGMGKRWDGWGRAENERDRIEEIWGGGG